MADAFRVTDRFHLTNRGVVYALKAYGSAEIKIGDCLYDLHGKSFHVKSIAMICRPEPPRGSELPVVLEADEGGEVAGNLLVRSPGRLSFLYAGSPLCEMRVDENYAAEYRAAGHPRALFSYEALEEGRLRLYGDEITGLTVYRGWMMPPERYRFFYEALEARGILLINTPSEYAYAHMLPNWYPDWESCTARSFWTEGRDIEDVVRISREMEGAAIVKDYVKSRKHEWYEACFIRDVQNEQEVRRVAGAFIRRQGDDLTGGVVLRQFEKLKPVGFHPQSGMPLSEEYRVFVCAGQVLTVDDYWQARSGAGLSESETAWVAALAAKGKSSFFTLDLARREDGSLMVMEMGDGQVSGLQQMPPERLYSAWAGLEGVS